MMHLVLLVWRHSGHYNTPARLAVLMRKVCNDVVAQCRKACDAPTLFDCAPAEAAEKLRAALRVCTALRDAYAEAAERSAAEVPRNPWRVPRAALFSRLDAFTERLSDLLELCHTAAQYARLEKVEVGGTKGRCTTLAVRALHTDFSSTLSRFHSLSYDLLDIDCPAFDADYAAFRASVRELDRRLAAAIGGAMDDCHSLGRSFKLLDSFEGILEREAVLADLEKKHLALVVECGGEVKAVAEMFAAGRAAPVLPKNAAPHSGAVAWARALRQRVEEPMERLRGLGRLLADSVEGAELEASHAQLLAQLTEFEAATISDWSAEAEETGEERLKQALLVRAADGSVAVNFDPALTKLLREVRYFQLQGVEVPPGAVRVFKRGEVLRQQTGNMELVARLYNEAQRVLLPIERPLVEKKLENVDAALERGLSSVSWDSPRVDEYIQELMAQVKDLDGIVAQLKGSVAATERILQGWAKRPMFDRREGRTYSVDEFADAFRTHLAARHAEVAEGAAEIQRLLHATSKKLLIPKGGSPSWVAYVESIGTLVTVRPDEAAPAPALTPPAPPPGPHRTGWWRPSRPL